MKRLALLLVLPLALLAQETYHVVLTAKERAKISSEVAAQIIEFNKRMGDEFKKGDVLVELDKVVYQAVYDKAVAELHIAEAQEESQKQLFEDSLASLLQVREAEARVITAKADLSIAKKFLDSCSVRAPYSGKVVDVIASPYEYAQKDEALIEIMDDSVLVAKLLVPSRYLPQMRRGDTLTVRVKETGERVMAKIVRLGSAIDPSSSLVKIDAEIDNRDGSLSPGMLGMTTLKE